MRSILKITSVMLLLSLMMLAAGQASPTQQQPGDGARRITAEEARVALEKRTAIIVDVRGESTYEAGHVKGALSIPFNELLSRMSELPRGKTIITYCS